MWPAQLYQPCLPRFFLLMSDFVLVPGPFVAGFDSFFNLAHFFNLFWDRFKLILWFSASIERALIVSCRARRDPTEFTTIINPSQEILIPNRQNIIIIYKLWQQYFIRQFKNFKWPQKSYRFFFKIFTAENLFKILEN